MFGVVMQASALEIVNSILQWVIAPIGAAVWLMYRQQQKHTTDIAVLEAKVATTQMAHDREIKEIRETSRAIMAKLDSIEAALRK